MEAGLGGAGMSPFAHAATLPRDYRQACLQLLSWAARKEGPQALARCRRAVLCMPPMQSRPCKLRPT